VWKFSTHIFLFSLFASCHCAIRADVVSQQHKMKSINFETSLFSVSHVIFSHHNSAEIRDLTLHISCAVTLELIFLLQNKRPTWCHLLFYFTSYVLNIFRTLIYPSSGACDCAVELPHRSFLFSVHCGLEIWCVWVWVVSVLQADSACNTVPDDGCINVRNMLST